MSDVAASRRAGRQLLHSCRSRAPTGCPGSQPDDRRGEILHHEPAQPADQGSHDHIEKIADRPLEDVGVRAIQGIEAVGSLDADRGPHQRPSQQHARQEDRHHEPANQHQRPDEARPGRRENRISSGAPAPGSAARPRPLQAWAAAAPRNRPATSPWPNAARRPSPPARRWPTAPRPRG